jgi:hypothetical protein
MKTKDGMTMSIIDTSRTPPRVVSGDAQEQARVQGIIDKRHAVTEAHCKAKGWPTNPAELTMAQIMEIRSLPEWKEAGRS